MEIVSFSKKPFAFRNLFLNAVRAGFSLAFGGESCVRCGKRALLMPLCSNCAKILAESSIGTNRCRKCGRPLLSEIEICTKCRENSAFSSADRIFPLWTYIAWRKQLIFLWKIKARRTISPLFSRLVEMKIREIESVCTEKLAVVPVPPRPHKIRIEGWDQIDELSEFLKKGFGRKILKILERTQKIQRKKLSRKMRLESVGKSYRAVSVRKIQNAFRGKIPESVILLDDVATTGSTIEECAKILKKIGIGQVFAVVLCAVE